jgi:hypothetical protein
MFSVTGLAIRRLYFSVTSSPNVQKFLSADYITKPRAKDACPAWKEKFISLTKEFK